MDLGVWDTDFRKVVVMRLDSLMIGVSAAYFALFYRKTWDFYSKTAIIFGLAILLLHKLLDEGLLYHKYFGITTSSLGVFLLLPYLSTMHCNRRIALMVVTHISVISYSMYLINYTVIRDISIPFIMKELSSVIVLPYSIKADLAYTPYWIATIAGAHFLTKYYEIPMLSIRDKLWPPPIHGIKDAHEGSALRKF